MNIKRIYSFRCPRWDELPEEPKFNKEVVAYINETFEPILEKEHYLTTTMVQNYIKWGILPNPKGRKYDRFQIACLIVITIYKQVLNIDYVKKGVDLLLKRMDREAAYNCFANSIELSIKREFGYLMKDKVQLKEEKLNDEYIGLLAVSSAFVLKLLANIVISSQGIENIGGRNE